ncbi:hypothetical protein TTHERM_00804760 (macronuclear) [Tetrahymena thermophila SB210]|uniref:Uncharacterized protein n=1 Tax=Tetrahymena thermophila (strain SB210) TaxID=312017 RepID=Q235C3_TETTS|nr:hypothetical protein TTHERM_00804760 [Tetrahymena thermophila SB210]EAR92180.2 hypothetical protein TTHERM_00804760 [Tetrahymena thermophila SB210]|eukprot:XP_001012425.2 hypothetical protein TTHERM_00804760 [Tetrahymena thermophila SB210]
MINQENENGTKIQIKSNENTKSFDQRIDEIENKLKQQQEFSILLIQILDQQTQALNSIQPIIKINNFNPNPIIQEIKEKFIKENVDLNSNQFEKLYEKVYCTSAVLEPLSILNQIEDKVDAKLEIVKEVKTKLTSATTRIEQQAAKILLLEQNTSKLSADLDQKPSKQEIKHLNDQIKISLTNFSNSLSLLADKDSVKYLLEKMQTLDQTMEQIVNKKYFSEQSEIMLNKSKEEILKIISNQYETKAQSLEYSQKAENLHKKFVVQFEKFREQNTLKIVNMEQLISDTRTKLNQKVDKNEYEEFKQWSAQFVHQTHIKHIYEHLIPIVKTSKKETEQCVQKLKIFEDFMNKIDESLLFKCEKMELKKLEQQMEESFLQKSVFENVLIQINQEHQQNMKQFEKKYEENNKIIFSSSKSQLFPLIKEEIKEQIQRYDIIQNKVADLIDTVKLELMKKADYSHIISLQNEKTSKKNTEDMYKEMKRINQNQLTLSHNFLNFMRQFVPCIENQSLQTRKKEILNAIENVSCLFEKMHNQNMMLNPAMNATFSNFNNFNNSNSRSMSPYEKTTLAKEIIKNNINFLTEEENYSIERKASKQFNAFNQSQFQADGSVMKENYQTQTSNYATVSSHTGRPKTTASVPYNSRPATPSGIGNIYKRSSSKGRPLKPLIQIQQQNQITCLNTLSSDYIAQKEIKQEIIEEQTQQLQFYIKNYRTKRDKSYTNESQKRSQSNAAEFQNTKKNSHSQEFKEQYPQRQSKKSPNKADLQNSLTQMPKKQNSTSQQNFSENEINFLNDEDFKVKKQNCIEIFQNDSQRQIKTSF